MKVIELEIGLIKPYENNAKMHPDSQIDNVATSIKKYGWQQPIVVDKNYTIIIGHCRHLAAQKLGLTTVPVVVADNLDDKQVKALRLVDNKSNESGWDLDLLKAEIPTLDLEDFDFDWGIPEEEPEVHDDEDFDVDVAMPVEPISKAGDIYELGDHRLMCGDSTNKNDVEKLMAGELADLLFTDPPYNVNVSNSEGMTIENDNLSNDDFVNLLNGAFNNAFTFMRHGASFYCWYADSEDLNFRTCITAAGLTIKQCLIWVKNGFNFGRQDYKWQHEPCLFGWKEGAAHYFVEEFNHSTVIDDTKNIDKLSKDELKATLKSILDGYASSVIHADKPRKNDLHPTMKNMSMCGGMISHSTRKGNIVLDLFGGSGTTLIACEQLGRRCRMMEYDPIYCDVIIKRWETLTGKKARKVN